MDTQNVSAQLYFQQLPEDKSAAAYNCENTFPNLSTCVNSTSSDTQIENAYQKQLDLSNYYNSPKVFQSVKEMYTDKTMANENVTIDDYVHPPPEPPSVPINIPVGPRDFLGHFVKEGFGGTSTTMFVIIGIILAVLAILFATKQ